MGKTDTEARAMRQTCLVALGSNMGLAGKGPAELLERAIIRLEERGFVIRAVSRFYQTPAFPAGAGPDFVNAAIELESAYDGEQILGHLHAVEAEFGRQRVQRWGARTLDLDLIGMGSLVLPDAKTQQYWRQLPLAQQKTMAPRELVIPHPRLAERGFVLVPVMDVAPDWCHPTTGLTIRQMHDALPEALRQEVVAL